jgi:hypothetical protein
MVLAHDCEQLDIWVHDNSTAATDSSSLMDVVIDPAGGTAWDTTNPKIPLLPAGWLQTESNTSTTGRHWTFPIWIPAGAAIGVRGQTTKATPGTPKVCMWAAGDSRDPSYWCGTRVDAIGANAADSGGAAVDVDDLGVWGVWTNIGAVTARVYGFLHPSFQSQASSPTSANSNSIQIELGIGGEPISHRYQFNTSASEWQFIHRPFGGIECSIPAGVQLQGRGTGMLPVTIDTIIHGVA